MDGTFWTDLWHPFVGLYVSRSVFDFWPIILIATCQMSCCFDGDGIKNSNWGLWLGHPATITPKRPYFLSFSLARLSTNYLINDAVDKSDKRRSEKKVLYWSLSISLQGRF
jgi:hypothetical protein